MGRSEPFRWEHSAYVKAFMEWLTTDYRDDTETDATTAKDWRLHVMLRLAQIRKEKD